MEEPGKLIVRGVSIFPLKPGVPLLKDFWALPCSYGSSPRYYLTIRMSPFHVIPIEMV